MFRSMKRWQNHFDVNNLSQNYRKVKGESKETMALELVTDGKNDKTEKNNKEYVHNKMFSSVFRLLLC